VLLKIQFFWDVTLHHFVFIDVSDDVISFVFRIRQYKESPEEAA